MGAANPEGEIAVHAMHAEAHLFAKRLGRGRQRVRIGHFKDGRDAAEHRATRTCLKVFLVGEAGLAEMHLTVDDAGQHMQAAAIHALPADQRKDRRSQRSSRL